MAAVGSDLENVHVGDREHWQDGPPHELFKRMRSECPVHWTEHIDRVPRRGRLLVGDDRRRRPHGQPRLADLLLRTRRRSPPPGCFPLELTRAMFIGMDPPKHDRVKALFQAGFTPKRIADHEERDPADRARGARPPRGPRELRPRQRRRPARRLARDRQLHGHPRGGRRDLGGADELDARRRRRGPQPGRASRRSWASTCPEIFERCRQADRRAPREPDRRPHERARARRGRRARNSRSTRS